MKLTTDGIRAERDYAALVNTLRAQLSGKPKPIVVSGLCTGAAYSFYMSVAKDSMDICGQPALFLTADESEAAKLSAYFGAAGMRVLYYPVRDLVFYNITASHDSEHERLSVLSAIKSGNYDVVITTPEAALQYTISPDIMSQRTFTLRLGDTVTQTELAGKLIESGYVRVDMVEGAGHFSVRGDIVDIFPPSPKGSEPIPYRIEFFGDDVDRICSFDAGTQRTITQIKEISIIPVRELYADADARLRIAECAEALAVKAKSETARAALRAERECAEAGLPMAFADKYLRLILKERSCLLDYLGGMRTVVSVESNNVRKRLDGFLHQQSEDIKVLLSDGEITPEAADYSFYDDKLDSYLSANAQIVCNAFSSAGLSGRMISAIYGFSTRRGVNYNSNMTLLCEDIITFMRGSYKIAVLCSGESAAKLTAAAIGEQGLPVALVDDIGIDDMTPGVAYVSWGFISEGFELTVPRFALLSFTDEDADRPKRHVNTDKRKQTNTAKIMSYNDLKLGDYVVHAAYGIGLYMGLENLTIDKVSRDYVKIKYAGTDLLYLPTDQLDLVSKYIGAHSDDGSVKLSKMGGSDWIRAKSRAKSAAKDMAKELIALYAARKRTEGYAFPADDDYQRGFELSFEYEETEGQLVAVEEIKRDMESPWPMDRLLCGDVGYGKTEVALRAAFKAILAGKQVALLVPTTILAFQHYNTAMARMRPYPVTVEMLSRFRTPQQQAEILRRLRRGDVDLIVGTHRIISQDIKFRDLGLLIIDEEQRFGVAQKERLKQMSVGVDVLTLTATPIPRTLNMAMNGIKDMSLLDEAPGNRLPVQTYVLEHDDAVIEEAVRRELRRSGQVFYLYNRIDSIHIVAQRLQKAFPDAKIVTAHGQMERERLETIWQSLLDGEIDILVCTTIIETGVDVPNANTLIIEDADRLGLAQLHQIRGRVGRSGRRAYAYFTFRRGKALSEISTKRLEAIREYTEFGSGFRVALRDMEIRGAGNLLGAQQHGHLDAVGYDMYVKILENAVIEEQGGVIPESPPDCVVDIKIDAFLAPSYIHSGAHRMEMYKKIARIECSDDCDDILDEMSDRFGEPPYAAMNLFTIALIRGIGRRCGIKAVEQREDELYIKPEHLDFELWSQTAEYFRAEKKQRLRLVSSSSPYISVKLQQGEKPAETALGLLKKFITLKGGIV